MFVAFTYFTKNIIRVPKKYEDYVRKEILELFQLTKPFYVEIDKIELNKSIVWIKMKENGELKK